jgi:hypothetical protein
VRKPLTTESTQAWRFLKTSDQPVGDFSFSSRARRQRGGARFDYRAKTLSIIYEATCPFCLYCTSFPTTLCTLGGFISLTLTMEAGERKRFG